MDITVLTVDGLLTEVTAVTSPKHDNPFGYITRVDSIYGSKVFFPSTIVYVRYTMRDDLEFIRSAFGDFKWTKGIARTPWKELVKVEVAENLTDSRRVLIKYDMGIRIEIISTWKVLVEMYTEYGK